MKEQVDIFIVIIQEIFDFAYLETLTNMLYIWLNKQREYSVLIYLSPSTLTSA